MFRMRPYQLYFMLEASLKHEYYQSQNLADVGVYEGLHKSQALGGSRATPFDRQGQQQEARRGLLKRFNRKQDGKPHHQR